VPTFTMDPKVQETVLQAFSATSDDLTGADQNVLDIYHEMRSALWGEAMDRLGPGVEHLHSSFNGIIKIFNDLGTGVLGATKLAQQAEDHNHEQVSSWVVDIDPTGA
jgi:hypothetical protein